MMTSRQRVFSRRPSAGGVVLAPLVLAAATLSALLGCAGARPIATVKLESVEFPESPPRIEAPIELCLDAELRQRQWNVSEHPFRVELGSRAALHFERLIKRHFSNVLVTFGPQCGSTSARPWITGRIVSANRELYNEVEDETQYTAIVLETILRSNDDEIIWQDVQDGVVGRPPALGGHALFAGWQKGSILFFPIDVLAAFEDRPRHTRACEDFGLALGLALQNTDLALTAATSSIEARLPSALPEEEASRAAHDARFSEPLAPLDPQATDPSGPAPSGVASPNDDGEAGERSAP
jgi:hypothetical protein